MEKRNWKRSVTLKQRMVLCLAAFFAAFALQLALNGYQARAVQQVQDDQMGNFNAISRFQGGVESSISILEAYRWENGETEEMLEKLRAACSTSNAWLWRIRSNMDGLQNVSDEQWVLYGAVETTYGSYSALLEELEGCLSSGQDAKASQLYYNKVSVCGGYLSQYTMQLLKASILDAQTTYTEISELGERIALMQIVVVALCVALGCASGLMVMRLLTPVSQMIVASRAISRSQFDTPDIPLPKQPEIGQLAESFNRMKHSMAQQVSTLQEKNEIERELHRQKTEALELQNRMERSRLQQLRSQIDPHFLFNTLNVIQQMAGTESAYRTQALIMALSHLLRYSLMSNDEQVPLSREVRIVDEYYSIYHVRFGDRVQMQWAFSDSLDLTETMVPSFILQPIVENAFKHGICPKEEGGVVRIRMIPLREKGLLCIRVLDNGVGIEPEQLQQLRTALEQPAPRWEHIGIYNVAARLRLLDARCRVVVRSRPGRGTAVILYDEKMEREALADIVMRRFEHEVTVEMAENGRKAADTAVLWGADLILMDIEMPGMNGLDAARAVLEQRPECKVIFITAYSLFQYAHEAVHLGACDYLLKPVDPDETEAAIRRAIRQIEAGRRLAELAAEAPEQETAPEQENDPAGEGESDRNALVMDHVRKYMEDNYMSDLSLDSVSEILHISPAYLSAQFKKYQKMNFLDCLTELRINAAKELLADPFRSAAEVASMVGYEDASYFARAFKKRTGMTPTQYRKEAAKAAREARL